MRVLAAADVWSLGVILTSLLVGQPPNVARRNEEGGSATRPKPSLGGGDAGAPDVVVHLPAALNAAPTDVLELIRAMLQPRPDDRPTASQVMALVDAMVMPPPHVAA